MENIDNVLNGLIKKGKTPSVSYLLFDGNSIIHSKYSGYSDIAKSTEADEKTSYCGFSTTKTFTAVGILQLTEKGMLNIDNKASLYLDDFPYPEEITIRQLLAHSSGIPNPNPMSWVHLPEEKPGFDRNSFFKQIFTENLKTKSAPNEKYGYSNLGYVFLGQIIEKVSGLNYEDYIRKNVLLPIGIDGSEMDFVIDDLKNHAKGYQKRFSLMNLILGFMMDKSKFMGVPEGKWRPFKTMYLNGASYGGLIGTPGGFMKYIQDLLSPDCRLLSEKYKRMLFIENLSNSNDKTGICLSWHKGELNGHDYYTHAGGGGGYYCEIRIYPELGLGSVIMFNKTGVTDERFLDKIDTYYIDAKTKH